MIVNPYTGTVVPADADFVHEMDSPWSVAQRNGISLAELVTLNPDLLTQGTLDRVPIGTHLKVRRLPEP